MMKKISIASFSKLARPARHAMAVAAAALVLSACGTSALSRYDGDGRVQEAIFPDAAKVSSWYESGANASISRVQELRIGDSRGAVQNALGLPHFSEGHGAKEWDYLLNVLSLDGQTTTRCQLKVAYDKNARVQSLHWLPSSCADLIKPAAAPAAIVAAPATAAVVAPAFKALSADALFGFDSHQLNAEGVAAVSSLATQIMAQAPTQRITVTGHTDRLGSDAYNRELAFKRANAVRNALISKGIAADRILSQGVGESLPVVDCNDSKLNRAQLIECLKPNRRVEITVAP